MDFKNQIELELYFSDHFDTILFPVLADIYLKNKDFKRARKVCDIGLNYHKNDGTYLTHFYAYSSTGFSSSFFSAAGASAGTSTLALSSFCFAMNSASCLSNFSY